MVKRILSVIILLFGATSLVASYQHQIKADKENSSVSAYESRRQIKTEIYYNQKVDSQPNQLEKSNLDKSVSVTPTSIIVGERELVSITSSDLDIKDGDMKQKKKEKYTYEVTSEEKEMLEHITEAEAEGRSIEARENVCSNIINRVESKEFPDSIESVIFQKHQYSSINNSRYYDLKISKETKEAVENVLKNGVTHKCLYYFNVKDISSNSIKNWINNSLVFEFKDDSGHSYYNERQGD